VVRLALRIVRGELRRGADLELDIVDVPKARGTSRKLGQVVLNLLVNALEAVSAMPPDKSVITVKLGATRGSVRLDVLDNGPSIPEEELPRAFDPFHVSASVRGGGLGLAISKALVEEMGGTLHVETRPNGGACFRVSLPVSD
jgi:two-component system NtrC family sensor kinase